MEPDDNLISPAGGAPADGQPLRTEPPHGDRSRMLSWIVLGVVIIGGLVYLSTQRRQNTSGEPIVTAEDVSGRVAPDFTLPTPDGRQISLAEFKGKPVVIDFWASWCGPCKIEMPTWVQLQEKYRAEGLTIIGISEDENDSDVRDFLHSQPLNYPVALDHELLRNTYGVPMQLPMTLFIRRDGTLESRLVGMETPDDLEKRVKGIL